MAKTGEDTVPLEDTVPVEAKDIVPGAKEDSVALRVVEIQAGPDTQPMASIAEEGVAEPSGDPVAVIFEAAMAEDFEILEELGNEGVKAVDWAARGFSESFQLFAAETTDFSKNYFENRAAFVNELLGAKTLGSAIQIQAGYTKSACARFLAHLVKMNDLYCNFLKKTPAPDEIAKTEVAEV